MATGGAGTPPRDALGEDDDADDDAEEEDEDDEGAEPPHQGHWNHRVKRCPEAQILQTLVSGSLPSLAEAGAQVWAQAGARAASDALQRGSWRGARREGLGHFLKVASLPSIPERPWQYSKGSQGSHRAAATKDRAARLRAAPAPLRLFGCTEADRAMPTSTALPSGVASRSSRSPRSPGTRPRPHRESCQHWAVGREGRDEEESLAVALPLPPRPRPAPLLAAPAAPALRFLHGLRGLPSLPARHDQLPTTKADVQAMALRRAGFVRDATARLEARLAALANLAGLASAATRGLLARRALGRGLGRTALPPQPDPEPHHTQSDSTIIPLHSPGGSPGAATPPRQAAPAGPTSTSGAAGPDGPPTPTLASFRFGRRGSEDSSSLSSAASSPAPFEDGALGLFGPLGRLGAVGHRNIYCTLDDPDGLERGADAGTAAPGLGRLPSVASCCCRICQNTASSERLISPCNCKGSLAYVHLSCLERWLNQSGRTNCELCQFQFDAEQTPRYDRMQSLRLWYSHPRNRRQLAADALIGAILTLVTTGLLVVTLVGMHYFVGEGTRVGISAFATQGTIVFFLALVAMGYVTTVVLLIRDQVSPWLRWWRTTVDIRLTLDSRRHASAAAGPVVV